MEQLESHLFAREDRQRPAEMIEVPAVLGQGDQFLGKRLDFLGFGQGRRILPCSRSAVARLRKSIRRCEGDRLNFRPAFW